MTFAKKIVLTYSGTLEQSKQCWSYGSSHLISSRIRSLAGSRMITPVTHHDTQRAPDPAALAHLGHCDRALESEPTYTNSTILHPAIYRKKVLRQPWQYRVPQPRQTNKIVQTFCTMTKSPTIINSPNLRVKVKSCCYRSQSSTVHQVRSPDPQVSSAIKSSRDIIY